MTDTTAVREVRQTSGAESRGRRLLFAVAGFEGKRIWRHPALLLAVVITGYELCQQVEWSRAPVLNRDSYTSAWPMILLAAGVYFAIGTAANRRHGIEDDDALRGVPVTPVIQTLGIGLAFISPLLVAILMQGTVLFLRSMNDPVTSIVWSEALVGPVTVALGAAAGLAVGWSFRSPLAVPLAGVGFAAGVLTVWWVASGFLLGPYTPYLAPVATLDANQYTLEQAYRPSIQHLLYLILLAAFFAVVATLRGQERRGRILSTALAIILLAGVGWAGTAQLRELAPAEEAARRAPYDPVTGDYVCEQRSTVIYCAYRGYEAWIEEWAAEVEPVLALLPEQMAHRPLEIRQQVPYYEGLYESEDLLPIEGGVPAGMWWSRQPYDSDLVAHRLGMALGAAGWAVGFPNELLPIEITIVDEEIVAEPGDPATTDPEFLSYRECASNDQGRAVAALWYATQSSPQSLEALRFQTSGERYGGGLSPKDNFAIDLGYRQPASSVEYLRREALVALELDRLPRHEVATAFASRWDQLIDPVTTTDEVAGWFGLSVPEMNRDVDSGTVPCP
jgi:hypothetical protein